MPGFCCFTDFIVANEMLLLWAPNHAGLAFGLSQLAFGTSSVTCTQIFSFLIFKLGLHRALILSSAFLCTLSLFPLLFLRYPDTVTTPPNTSRLSQDVIDATAVSHESTNGLAIHWKLILCLPTFWLYLITVLTSGVSFAFNPYFYKLGHTFGKSQWELVPWFQATEMTATLMSFFVAMATDVFRKRRGYFYSGSRNFCLLFLFLQVILFAICAASSSYGVFPLYICSVAVLKVVMFCHEGLAALLARDFFGTSNTIIVFGFGAGLALGFGEGLSAWAMSLVETLHRSPGTLIEHLLPSAYNEFYYAAALWSIIGLVCALLLRRPVSIFPPNSLTHYQSLSLSPPPALTPLRNIDVDTSSQSNNSLDFRNQPS